LKLFSASQDACGHLALKCFIDVDDRRNDDLGEGCSGSQLAAIYRLYVGRVAELR
jgi:hypothetical protein